LITDEFRNTTRAVLETSERASVEAEFTREIDKLRRDCHDKAGSVTRALRELKSGD
jgi:hypothetical protein